MKVKTRYFGEIELDDSKVITFDNGLFGFEEFTRFALLYDSETGESTSIKWLQCVDEETLALPVMMPTLVKPDYDPIIEDGVLDALGNWNENNISVLVTITVPSDHQHEGSHHHQYREHEGRSGSGRESRLRNQV